MGDDTEAVGARPTRRFVKWVSVPAVLLGSACVVYFGGLWATPPTSVSSTKATVELYDKGFWCHLLGLGCPKPAPKLPPCKPTKVKCSAFKDCGMWLLKKNAGAIEGNSQKKCCDLVCRAFVCGPGWMKKPNID